MEKNQATSQTLKNNWKGQTVVCVGGGPSLSRDDVDYARDKAKVIAINDAYIIAPWCDLHYACDNKWWVWHHKKTTDLKERWTSSPEAAKEHNINYISGQHKEGLSDSPNVIYFGQNSGYQAINIAYLKGAARVLLLGYDMKISTKNESHWFGDHPDKVRSNYRSWLPAFDSIAKQGLIEVINCTPNSALKSFPNMHIKDCL